MDLAVAAPHSCCSRTADSALVVTAVAIIAKGSASSGKAETVSATASGSTRDSDR
jgi:hypothetical protein